MVVIEEYDGKGKPHTVALDRVQVWAQIHDTPELYRREGILDQLARRIGQVKSMEMNPNRFFEGNYVRVRVKIKIDEPLVRFTPLKIRGEEALLLPVKYEKVGFFCEVCGVMGHVLEECGDGVHGPDEVQYGQWMVANRRSLAANQYPQHSSNPPRTRGRRGRGGGPHGHATSNSRTENAAKKRSSQEAGMSEDENVEDTAESPMKPMQMEQDEGEPPQTESSAKKRLDMSNATTAGPTNPGDDHQSTTNMREASELPEHTPPPPQAYVAPRDRKKHRPVFHCYKKN
ncbi:hypothetical protein D1007_25438 [Hordeum vulgare]|nr:hypothetical protein D1007_25438 [Hordeum vulgare]